MPKIAVLHKGPTRPDWKTCKKNIEDINTIFSNYEIDNFIFTWENNESKELKKNTNYKYTYLIKEPTNEFIDSVFFHQTPHGCNKYNAYKHFWIMRESTRLINSIEREYTHVIYTRMDTSYEFKDINSLLTDKYSRLVNYVDLVGIAPPEIMEKAWDYISLEKLNDLYGNSKEPEGCWKKILDLNNVKCNEFSGFDESCDPHGKEYKIKYLMNPRRNK